MIGAKAAGENQNRVAGPGDDVPALERFLTLSNEQLDRVQQAVT